MRIYCRGIILHLLALSIICFATPALSQDPLEREIYERIEAGAAQVLGLHVHGYDAASIDAVLMRWYDERSFLPFWLEGNAPSQRAAEAKQFIEQSEREGLDPNDYFIKLINERWSRKDPKSLAQLELLLTLAVGRLAADAAEGRLEPLEIDRKLFAAVRPERPDLQQMIKRVVGREDIAQALQAQFPKHRQYQRMRSALADYTAILREGGWRTIPEGPVLAEGASGPNVLALAQRLAKSADLVGTQPSEQFDGTLTAALIKFQRRHGLPGNGKLDTLTRAALNVPVEDRVKSLIMNLERWRWLRRDLQEEKEVLVNIAGYEVFGLSEGSPELRLPVIIGKTYHATPVFSDRIRYIEVNPFWNVTPDIGSNEVLPKMKKDSGYLKKQHMRLYNGWGSDATEVAPSSIDWSSMSAKQFRRYAVRQDPGPWNALGIYKFVFPNTYNVYLHDTSNRVLFDAKDRALSHGCIRVSNPEKLALFLLDSPDDHWDSARLKQVVESGKNTNLKLKAPVPIHLTYRTAWVDSDSTVQFRPDLYARDAKMAKVLFK